ncbi:dTDP-4-dehydrorhamnose 3,5-epimerase family protein [Rhodococcus coprophilus]|uniref:dTDP-4-dehydrorhamnose 3,5-epimerase n=1 Tax=Rhodococcus coprophilus TaxID=38310 RepID=A0A2X4XD67_9NOCA|nr:dTDP-4-dehydrorhamnose 3,5-epimerase family protein [Rhodococcus coprophilus]MBM7459951.1 dTDP-4-dehydrorhamnose 3,5-epimerase-like enzyme [Rhodococcus coprophilus]SQI37775.1 dTDP-4-dehydrorhamnose 3,5-epimerase [Rhodococcus coprophilus]
MSFAIDGLSWIENWRMPNGGQSYVVPFPTLRPSTIVFHGEEEFTYGHYGIHLGQADVLTFLGDESQVITGHFIDCRIDSPTRNTIEHHTWSPSSGRHLRIPPGIAHAFDGLERIHTLNTYDCYLPAEDQIDKTSWNPDSDVINVPIDADPLEVALFQPNSKAASERWYRLLAKQQYNAISANSEEYPLTMDVSFDDGQSRRIKLRKVNAKKRNPHPDIEPIVGIDGLQWRAHPILWSGPNSGFVPLTDAAPMYFIDHGTDRYTHDAYGIHLTQEDRLTFLGPPDHTVRAHFVDLREGSPTLHATVSVDFTPSAGRYLAIPAGVAHAFDGLERVFTVNKPQSYVKAENDGIDTINGNDVLDWPLDQRPFPVLTPLTVPASETFYQQRAALQQELVSRPPATGTPAVLMIDGPDGQPVKIAVRKKVAAGAHPPTNAGVDTKERALRKA